MLGLSCQSVQCFVSSLTYKLLPLLKIWCAGVFLEQSYFHTVTGQEEKRGGYVPGPPSETQG